MPRTPDDFPGINQADGLRLYDDGYGLPGTEREIRYSDGYFYAKDAYGTFNLRSGGGISEAEHEELDTLTHDIVEDSYDEATYAGKKIINLTVYTDVSKTTKVREEQVSYDFFGRINQAITIQYDSGGSESYRVTENITYQLGKIKSITRTRS